jgi:hypothetical protein
LIGQPGCTGIDPGDALDFDSRIERRSACRDCAIVLEGLRGETGIAELCRKEGINQNPYYRWSKEFLEAGKKRWRCGERSILHAVGRRTS